MVLHMKLYPNSLPRQADKKEGCTGLITWKNAAVCLMLAAGFVLYTKYLLQDAMQRANFPGYLSRKLDYGEDNNVYTTGFDGDGMIKSPAPAAITTAVPATDDNNHLNASPEPGESPAPKKKEQTEELQGNSPAIESHSPPPPGQQKLRVLVGVFIMAYQFKRRELIRKTDLAQSSEYADFTVRFIMGGFTLPEWLEVENVTNGDLIVLQCKENLNEGKTFIYFSSLPTILSVEYDYVMKTDDDSYVRFENLGKHLNSFPRTDLYYGYTLPCGPNAWHAPFRVGAGYIISWDLVLWIRDSPIPRNHTVGTEDWLVGDWFREGGVAKNQPTSASLFHDHPKQGGTCALNLTAEVILVHKLKSDERWEDVVAFFEKSGSNGSKSVNNW